MSAVRFFSPIRWCTNRNIFLKYFSYNGLKASGSSCDFRINVSSFSESTSSWGAWMITSGFLFVVNSASKMQDFEKDTVQNEKYLHNSYTVEYGCSFAKLANFCGAIFRTPKEAYMKPGKTHINPIYRDLIIVFAISLGIAVGMVSAAVIIWDYLP